MHEDAIDKGERILIVDDLIATGGTAEAAAKLVQRSGGEIVGATFIIDLPELGGMKKLGGARHREPRADGVRGALAGHGARRGPAARGRSAASPPGAPIRARRWPVPRAATAGLDDHRPLGAALRGVVCARRLPPCGLDETLHIRARIAAPCHIALDLSEREHRRQGVSHDLARRRTAGRWRSSTRPGCRTRSPSSRSKTLEDAARAIKTMQVRGAPLIGATAAYGVCLALRAGCLRRGARPRHRATWPSSARPPSTCAGRWTRCAPPCATCRATGASPPPTRAPPRSATPTSRPTAPSACTAPS